MGWRQPPTPFSHPLGYYFVLPRAPDGEHYARLAGVWAVWSRRRGRWLPLERVVRERLAEVHGDELFRFPLREKRSLDGSEKTR